MPAFGQSYYQSQAWLMFVTTLGMDNFDYTKMIAHLKKIHSLSTGGAHSRAEASITSPTFPLYVGKQLPSRFRNAIKGVALQYTYVSLSVPAL